MPDLKTAWFDASMSYQQVYDAQQYWVDKRRSNEVSDALWLGEHPHTITCGRKTHDENLLQVEGVTVVPIERGGDVTYHGPGQLMMYPILQLQEGEKDVHRHLRLLEQWAIDLIADYGLEGYRNEGWTGVWVKDSAGQARKIASVGVAVKQWVTYHGIALNVSTDLSYFERLNPCGLPAAVMTSMAQLLSEAPLCRDLAQQGVAHAARLWQREYNASEVLPPLAPLLASMSNH